jgi:hypothetical protein
MADIVTTIGALVDAEPALQKLTSVKLDAKTRYHAVKLAKLVAAETRVHFYEPQREAFKEFGVEREPTPAEVRQFGPDKLFDIATASPEQRAAFTARIKDLRAVEVPIPWGPITLTMLEPYPEFTGADMLALGPLCDLG